jgi:hypothetical protein
VIHTLPHQRDLDRLVLANRTRLYGLLFRSSAETLLELAADPRYLGARIGILAVLHTWGQLMDTHTHLHVVVPGGGMSPDGSRWVACRDGFFVPVAVIAALFRGKFLAGLKKMWREGKLRLEGKLSHLADKRSFESWLSTLYHKQWVVHAQGPPAGVEGADAVLKYLARYVSGVAISDRRLISHVGGRVVFRWKNYRSGGTEQTTSVSGLEFVRRYMLHVLPRGLVRIRYYGLLSNRCRKHDLMRCRALIGDVRMAPPVDDGISSSLDLAEAKLLGSTEGLLCPHCKRGRLVLVDTWQRASGWPWCSPASRVVHERPMENTFEDFIARRCMAPAAVGQSLGEDTS